MLCSNCGKEITPGRKFCGHCGQAITVSQPPVVDDEAFTRLESNTAFPPDLISQATPVPQPGVAQIKCPSCSQLNPAAARFCNACGITLAIVQPAPVSPAVPVNITGKGRLSVKLVFLVLLGWIGGGIVIYLMMYLVQQILFSL